MAKTKKNEEILETISDIKEEIATLEETINNTELEEIPAVPESNIETIVNDETGKEEIIITEENAAEVAQMLQEEFAADPVPFETPTELTLGGVKYEFNENEFQGFIKEQLIAVLERSQMTKEFYNAKLKLKHELTRLIDSI